MGEIGERDGLERASQYEFAKMTSFEHPGFNRGPSVRLLWPEPFFVITTDWIADLRCCCRGNILVSKRKLL